MITQELIKRRIENFWGYGSFEAPIWFVGMEEGRDPKANENDLEERFRAADGKHTVDMRRDMMNVPDHIQFFRPGGSIQASWKYLVALHLFLESNLEPTTEDIRKYQTLYLGDSLRKETAGIELMPLPSQKAHESTWLYKKYNVHGLESRKDYLNTYKPKRVYELEKLIEKHVPKLVIFYSLTYMNDWVQIIGQKPDEITHQMYFLKTYQTSFGIVPQGSAFGMSYERCYEYGEKIRKLMYNEVNEVEDESDDISVKGTTNYLEFEI